MKPWMLELVETIEAEDKGELEEAYGVEFDPDSVPLCCRIITSFSDDFKEETNHDKERERLLKDDIVRVLDAACRRVTSNLHNLVEKDGLDIEYLLHRACVEFAAIRKEKERPTCRLWMHRVRKEYHNLIDTWHKLEKKWKLLLLSLSETRAEELGMLKQVHEELVSYLQDEKAAVEEVEVSSRTRMFEQLNVLRAKIELSINRDLKQILTVGQVEIVAAAREILRIPALWRNRFFKPNYNDLNDLKTAMANRVYGQDHAIGAITRALSDSKTGSGKGPVRSFLFICGSDAGGEDLTKVLAEQLFHDEQRVIEFDLGENTQDDSVKELDVRQIKVGLLEYSEVYWRNDKECGFRRELIDAVKKMPGTVIVLRNVEKAHASVTEFLVEILRSGKIEDWEGKMVDFTQTLIIMTSDDSHVYYYEMPRTWKCDCDLMTGKLFLKEQKKVRHRNCYLHTLRHAKRLFKPELLDIIDNMIVFRMLMHRDLRIFTRLQLRILANSIGRGRIIVYPSEALLNIITPLTHLKYKDIMNPFVQQIVPKLREIYNQSRNVRSIVYIDALVGTSEFSLRVETGGCFTGDEEFDHFLASDVCQFRHIYQTHILWLRTINGLSKTLGWVKNSAHLQRLAYKIRNLLTKSQSCTRSLEMMVLSSSATLDGSDRRPKKRDMKEKEDLQKRLFTGSETQHYVFRTVANAMLGWANINYHAMPMTALLLGLATAAKANLPRDLAKLVDDENNGTTNTKLLLQIDLSYCSDYDKFFKLIYNGHNRSFGYPERVGMRPGSILLIDRVEKAPMSVFSGLLSLLDHRMLSDSNRECIIDLTDTVIIIVSDLGNRDFIVGMFEQESERKKKSETAWDDLQRNQQPDVSTWEEYKKTVDIQKQRSRFRTELLNRVDEIVFFNPCVGEQLTSFARLPMIKGPHIKTRSTTGSLSNALKCIFDESNYKLIPALVCMMTYSEQLLSQGIIASDSDQQIMKAECTA